MWVFTVIQSRHAYLLLQVTTLSKHTIDLVQMARTHGANKILDSLRAVLHFLRHGIETTSHTPPALDDQPHLEQISLTSDFWVEFFVGIITGYYCGMMMLLKWLI